MTIKQKALSILIALDFETSWPGIKSSKYVKIIVNRIVRSSSRMQLVYVLPINSSEMERII